MHVPRSLVGLALLLVSTGLAAEEAPTAVLVTVDDLPISAGRFHPDPADRATITRGMLAALERHEIRAVGLVTWRNVRDESDLALLDMWLDAGHELGNHSYGHLDYSRTEPGPYIEDVERARRELAAFLEPRGRALRFFRFPYLREGDTRDKLSAMRQYLEQSGQRNLRVTLDNQDWSFEAPWVEAARDGNERALEVVGQDFQAALRIAVRHHERQSAELFDRAVPQVLLLHATAVGAAQWDRLFDWLIETGHRFATVDEVLEDPAFQQEVDYVGPRGFGLWDRLLAQTRAAEAREAVTRLLLAQAEAWSAGDLEGFCSGYSEDALYVSPTGPVHGRQAILDRYRVRYPDRAAMGRLTFEIIGFEAFAGVEVSLLGDARPSRVHGASVTARWMLTYPDRDVASGMTLLTLRPTSSGWRIVQDASM
jgi:peptidoglycan/xylan/chitin deacetylase (PgdA/CDA1 family)